MRDRIYQQSFEVFDRLASGKPCTIATFDDLGLSEKTILRMLASAMSVPGLGIRRVRRGDHWVWYSNYMQQRKRWDLKRCMHCLEPKPLEEYWANSFRPDGKQDYCKQCQNKRSGEFRRKRRDHVNALQRRKYRRHKRRILAAHKVYYEENRAAILARKKQRYRASVAARVEAT